MATLRYLTHPNVAVDPDVAVPAWSLSEQGRRRAEAMLSQPWVPSVGRVVSIAAVADLLVDGDRDVAVVGHGAVGTLLWCHLNGTAIARHHDQPGQGHHWAYDRTAARMVHGWRPIDDLRAPVDPQG